MNAADPQGSPSHRGGRSSSTPPPSERCVGRSCTLPGAGSKPEVIKVDDGKAVLVITLELVYMKREVHELPVDIVQAVDHFTVPAGYRREGSRERSFTYSLLVGVYAVPLEEEGDKYKNFCLPAGSLQNGDGSTVNTNHARKNMFVFSLCTLEPYPGYLPEYSPAKNFCKFCMIFIPVPGSSVQGMFCSLRPWPQYPGNGYSIFIPARNSCEFCTPVP